jgi:hypothetical protein
MMTPALDALKSQILRLEAQRAVEACPTVRKSIAHHIHTLQVWALEILQQQD